MILQEILIFLLVLALVFSLGFHLGEEHNKAKIHSLAIALDADVKELETLLKELRVLK